MELKSSRNGKGKVAAFPISKTLNDLLNSRIHKLDSFDISVKSYCIWLS